MDVDRYGRLVMRCFAGKTDIAEHLVANGLALAYRRYSTDYVAAEAGAREDRRGLWAGEFEAPWDWRRRN
jgi:endonuclease YncB( thermonuclease family)